MNRETELILGLVDPDAPRPAPAATAEVAARILDGTAAMETTRENMAELAARLDCGLADAAQERLDHALAADGQALQDLAASAQLVETVAARLVPLPADLLEQATATPFAAPRPARRLAPWLWLGGAALAAALAAMLLLQRQPLPSDPRAPLVATPAPKDDATPRMAPAGNPDVVPGKR